jgi:hypothetical protein
MSARKTIVRVLLSSAALMALIVIGEREALAQTTCDGTEFNGSCWYLGWPNESCTSVCSYHGGYDPATCDYAAAYSANCDNVLDAILGCDYWGFWGSDWYGYHMGCHEWDGFGFRDLSGCTADGTPGDGSARVCACVDGDVDTDTDSDTDTDTDTDSDVDADTDSDVDTWPDLCLSCSENVTRTGPSPYVLLEMSGYNPPSKDWAMVNFDGSLVLVADPYDAEGPGRWAPFAARSNYTGVGIGSLTLDGFPVEIRGQEGDNSELRIVARETNHYSTLRFCEGDRCRQGMMWQYDGMIGHDRLRLQGFKIGKDIPIAISVDRDSGNVGIGIDADPLERENGGIALSVAGTIKAEEIIVSTEWSDYVFEDDYALMTLDDVEKYIDDYGHLPDMPSTKEVEESGISIGESQAKLLQKIEELTLYIIEQNKRIEKLEKQTAVSGRIL